MDTIEGTVNRAGAQNVELEELLGTVFQLGSVGSTIPELTRFLTPRDQQSAQQHAPVLPSGLVRVSGNLNIRERIQGQG